MKLVVVESPTKARKIGQYLGDEFVVKASLGHVRDLPKSKIGVDIDGNFEPVYEVPTKSKKVISELKKLGKEADEIYLATDPDREGEAISWHLLEAWKDDKLNQKSKRAVFHEITKEAVLDALKSPSSINDDLVDAQQARRVLDRLVGYKISPILWKKVRTGLSAGRVQSVALRLIVEREEEIENFKPEEYWEVDLDLATKAGEQLVARVVELNNKKYEPKTAAEVDGIRDWVPGAEYSVKEVERKERKRSAFPPFTTSTLQQAAANRLGMSSKQSMMLAQQLYEEGLITYHRTDSVNLSNQAIAMAREYISQRFGAEALPEKPNYYKAKSKNAQEAHEAIRPTAMMAKMPEEGKLTDRHAKLYDLIFRRFVASQMVQAIYDVTTIHVAGRSGSHSLLARTSGSILKRAGWMELFPGGEEKLLPSVEEKESLSFTNLLTEQKFTQPPPRYNDASLVKELEKRGIGRPSTYASIISVLETRRYVRREAKAFIPTPVGRTVVKFLQQYFDQIMDYDFTAKMEDELDEISRGEKDWTAVLRNFYSPFAEKLGAVADTAERMRVPVEPLNKPCPVCGLSEEEFAKQQPAISENPRDDEKGQLVLRSGRFGKFISCSRYPDCKHTERFQEKIDMTCPQCNQGDVVVKRTKKGRIFYGCSRYPECDFASWEKPQGAPTSEGEQGESSAGQANAAQAE